MHDARIDVLVAEDSKVTRMFLVHLLESDPRIRVVAAVRDGQAALDFINENKPDVVLMDIHMPRMDGFEATRRIMETRPCPIVICSATADIKDVVITFRAIEAGAVACIEKPAGERHPNRDSVAANLLQTIKLMAEVKVVRRWPRAARVPERAPRASDAQYPGVRPKVIGVGASTGGPPVLQTILAGLPKDFGVPILIVQHIARGFLTGLVEWLNQTTDCEVHVASHGIRPLAGHVYVAPDDLHMGLSANGSIALAAHPPENGLRPAVSFLFRSLSDVCGASALGVLLTGMGKDGAAELKLMKDRGAITIVQDQETSVVNGMPGAAQALGAATYVLPADKISDALIGLVYRSTDKRD